MTDAKKPVKKLHSIIQDDSKVVCVACGEKFLYKDGSHVCADAKKPEPDGIRAAAAEISDLFNPQINPDLCRDGKARLKKMRAILRREVDAVRVWIALTLIDELVSTGYPKEKALTLARRIRQGGK